MASVQGLTLFLACLHCSIRFLPYLSSSRLFLTPCISLPVRLVFQQTLYNIVCTSNLLFLSFFLSFFFSFPLLTRRIYLVTILFEFERKILIRKITFQLLLLLFCGIIRLLSITFESFHSKNL